MGAITEKPSEEDFDEDKFFKKDEVKKNNDNWDNQISLSGSTSFRYLPCKI
jgi:hypothetical protein